MTILIESSQLKYFKQNGQIEFESFFSSQSAKSIKNYFTHFSSNQPLIVGFDIWRKDPLFKKDLCSPKHPQILMQLLEIPKIRYGFSQYIGPQCQNSEVTLLSRKSCIQTLVGGVCIALKDIDESENPFCPTQEGSAIFFKMDEDFYLRYPQAKGEYLWIFFTSPKAFFLHQPEDPLYSFFRQLGYEHGDSLKETLNPLFQWKIR